MPLSPERVPLPSGFTRLSWASVLTQLAEQLVLVAAPLLAVLALGVGAAETALLQVAQTLPFLLLAVPFGLLVDRTAPRRVLLGSEALRTTTLAAVVGLLLLESLTFPALLALGFVGAIGTMGLSVAVPASVPRLVGREQLVPANRWLELGRSAAFISGPVLGGAAVAAGGGTTAFVAATIACAAALALLATTRVPRGELAPRSRPWREVGDGLRFVFTHALLRAMIVTSLLFNVGWFLLQSVFVVYALERLGMTPELIGVALGAFGVGMVLGALSAGWLSSRVPLGRMALLGPMGGFAAALLVAATLWFPIPALAVLSYFLFGLGPVLWTIGTTSLRQAVTPTRMIGRVSAVLVVATYGARPIGAGLGAALAATAGIEWCIAGCAVLFAAQLLYVLRSRLPRVRELPEPGAGAAGADPATRVAAE
ncbi:MFS transporter [Agromyces mediolanus]|uniref:MFS transporter n=1 Tax=Agromyces mediolanus TaxID=41986 RepID=A0A918CJ04_AGRME|nr:MFS transporter [Agromyces mediolanus]GGR27668.1 MFS transporter [Agromyces mediolanus]GLJ71963.1 MFS transporter [Agromyces mediolanus]